MIPITAATTSMQNTFTLLVLW